MHNPFQEKIEEQISDMAYIKRALEGDAAALEALVLRHQSWIFNIALNMTGDIQRAEDVMMITGPPFAPGCIGLSPIMSST